MQDPIKRLIKVGDWYFEVKAVRALKVDEFGQPYSAIANVSLNGETAFIDGQMTRDGEDFSKADWRAFNDFLDQLDIKQATWDRMKNGNRHSRTYDVDSQHNKLRLLKA